MSEIDSKFYDRVDEQINLSNTQLTTGIESAYVNNSNLYATARFNAWTVARNWNSGEAMEKGKQHTIEYFVRQYQKLLEENLNDYIQNFDEYMKPKS